MSNNTFEPHEDADAFRLMEAEELLRLAGFVPVGDGTWRPWNPGDGVS